MSTHSVEDGELVDRVMGPRFRANLPAVAQSYDEVAALARAEGEAKGRREAIEECARVADDAARYLPMEDRVMLASRCGMLATRIRALAEPPAAEEKPT